MDNDLISRSAAKDEILSWAVIINKPHLLSKEDTLHVLDTLPAVDAGPKWISVKDRLPELIPCNAGTAYSEAVIVWTTGRKAMVAVWDGIDFLCAADYWEAWGERITHWMPLPEPPKEG